MIQFTPGERVSASGLYIIVTLVILNISNSTMHLDFYCFKSCKHVPNFVKNNPSISLREKAEKLNLDKRAQSSRPLFKSIVTLQIKTY